jgi:hypothetical protein
MLHGAFLLALVALDDAPSPEIQKLLGPYVAMGKGAPLDEILLKRGREYADQLPIKYTIDVNGDGAIDTTDAFFYDLPLILYRNYYRSGDAYWREKARTTSKEWRDYPGNQKMRGWLKGDWKLWREIVNQPRNFNTLGLAVYALESNDAAAKQVVYDHAAQVEQAWMYGPYQSLTNEMMPLGDPRECGYSLMALLAATVVGEDHKKSAKDLLDHILKAQQADGQWLSSDGGGYTSNYMVGLLMESLLLYDRVVGDERILAAIEKNLAWTWSTQWVEAREGFKYHSQKEIEAQPALNGLLLPAWGYAYYKTGKAQYLEQGNRIAKGLAGPGAKEMWGVKQFNQFFRSSPQFAGYVELRPANR